MLVARQTGKGPGGVGLPPLAVRGDATVAPDGYGRFGVATWAPSSGVRPDAALGDDTHAGADGRRGR